MALATAATLNVETLYKCDMKLKISNLFTIIRSDMKIALAWGSGRRGSLLSSGGWLLVLLE